MSYQDLIDKAKPCLHEATRLDAENAHMQAFKSYMRGIDFLEEAIKGRVEHYIVTVHPRQLLQ